jgi:hypothetical protein
MKDQLEELIKEFRYGPYRDLVATYQKQPFQPNKTNDTYTKVIDKLINELQSLINKQ